MKQTDLLIVITTCEKRGQIYLLSLQPTELKSLVPTAHPTRAQSLLAISFQM